LAVNKFDLSGKVALVTGARSGLGQSLAIALAEAGASIIGLGSRAMPETAQFVRATGQSFVEVIFDLRDVRNIGDAVTALRREQGPISILVNNAGIIRRAPVLEFTEPDWDAVMDVNLKALFFVSQSVARSMAIDAVAGRIINIASLLSFQGGLRVPAYTASKHGVAGITRLMANELAPLGITVNAIAPGYMLTENTAPLRADPIREKQILERIPAGRWGRAEDLASAVLFFASPASAYVTGTILPVDGGWLAR